MLTFSFTPFPVLTTKRLVLRQIEPADLNVFYRMRTDPAVRRYLDRPLQSREEVATMLQKIRDNATNNESIHWTISRKDDPALMGDMSFWRTMPEHHRAEIGYCLLPEYWGLGIASEALQAVLTYGFGPMGLHSVEANVNPENAASKSLLEKAGFRLEAHFRENYHHDGRFLDSYIYSLLTQHFKATSTSETA